MLTCRARFTPLSVMSTMHAWYSPKQEGIVGTFRYKAHEIVAPLFGVDGMVHVTQVSERRDGGPAFPDAIYLGTVGDFVSTHPRAR